MKFSNIHIIIHDTIYSRNTSLVNIQKNNLIYHINRTKTNHMISIDEEKAYSKI